MSKNTDQYETDESNYFQIIKNNVTPLDLFIISKLNEGMAIEEIASLVKKDFDIENPKKTVEKRFNKLVSEDKPEKRIIQKETPLYIIDPSKLFNNISLVFIKASVDSSEKKNLDIGIKNVFETIVNLNNKPRFGKPIKQLFTITGWMYDFFGIIYENNIDRFHSFRNHLLNEGIADTVDIIPVDTGRGFLFNPIASPDHKKFKQFLVHYHHRMGLMTNELTKNDVKSTETMRFFDKDECGLHVISGKNKGEIYPVDVAELKIGRYQDNDIILQDIAVSRRHAVISKVGNKHIFKDKSTNGSVVNDTKIIYDEIELNDGDIIKIGENTFQFKNLGKMNKSRNR
jgi:hypothetical protein